MSPARARRTKGENIVLRRTADQRRRRVKRIAIITGTRLLEDHGVHKRFTLLGPPVLLPTTEPVTIKSQTRALTRHHLPFTVHFLKLLRTRVLQLPHAPSDYALGVHDFRRHRNGDVVPVHQADVVEVWLAFVTLEGDLD